MNECTKNTPERINARDDVSLAEKHNEALLLMPTLFSEAGYTVTVFNPPYAGDRENCMRHHRFHAVPERFSKPDRKAFSDAGHNSAEGVALFRGSVKCGRPHRPVL